jgi:hypothetical protein
MREQLKKYTFFHWLYQLKMMFSQFIRFQPFAIVKESRWYDKDWRWYKLNASQNPNFELRFRDRLPMIADKTSHTPLDSIYFHQDSWGVRQIARVNPDRHVDVGSSAMTMVMVAQFVPVTMVDIRPLPYEAPGLTFQEGSILDLPFESNSISSISSLCVVEHIGLGRYGDPLDVWGSEKAVKELQRVVKPGGHIIFSVPVDEQNRIYFNAHRAFTPSYVNQLFSDCSCVESMYIYKGKLQEKYEPQLGYGVGLFLYKKNG